MKNGFLHGRVRLATAIALLFHIIGIIGILFFDASFFIKTTPLNLLLMFLLILYTQQQLNIPFMLFFFCCFAVGIIVEIIGTHTGYLFGEYSYGNVLGPSIAGVPWIIGINWFIVIYCCGITVQTLLNRLLDKLSTDTEAPRPLLKTLTIVADGATMAVLFDWLMEPVAIKLGYWKWGADGSVPFYNYLCWFAVSLLLLLVFNKAGFGKQNKFAVHLLLIQAMFFLLLRTFL